MSGHDHGLFSNHHSQAQGGGPKEEVCPPHKGTVCSWAQLWAGVSRSPWELLEELDTC